MSIYLLIFLLLAAGTLLEYFRPQIKTYAYWICWAAMTGCLCFRFGQGTDYANIARKFDFKINGNLRQTPFLVKDGLSEKQAIALKQELRNMGMSAQVIRSSSEIQAIKKRSLLGVLFSK